MTVSGGVVWSEEGSGMQGLPHFLRRESQAFYWILEAVCITRPRQGLHAAVFLQILTYDKVQFRDLQ